MLPRWMRVPDAQGAERECRKGYHMSCLLYTSGHGGLFKTKGVGQQILADAVNAPVSVMATAGEGGAWGMALLASYLVNKEEGETLESFLDNKVFADQEAAHWIQNRKVWLDSMHLWTAI